MYTDVLSLIVCIYKREFPFYNFSHHQNYPHVCAALVVFRLIKQHISQKHYSYIVNVHKSDLNQKIRKGGPMQYIRIRFWAGKLAGT
jgi:hypothetical protein